MVRRHHTLSHAERTQVSDARMIECAIRLIVERGVTGMKLTEVGLQSGYSRGLAAVRFGTKAELLRRVARHALSGWIGRVTQAVGASTGLHAVCAAIDAQDAWIRETTQEMRALYAIFFQSTDAGAEYHMNVAHAVTAQRRDIAGWLREARDAGEVPPSVEPADTAAKILSTMLGIVYQFIMDPSVDAHRLHEILKDDVRALAGPVRGVPHRSPLAVAAGTAPANRSRRASRT